ncbi:MAG: endolytic transglycosylase MltG [bacterium]
MSDGPDWQDPLSESDDAAAERERRRAEREARRRERQGSIGERVREEMAEDPPPAAPPPQRTEARAAQPPPPGPPRAAVNRRRLGALLALAALAFVAFVVVVAAKRLGGDDPAPAKPQKELKTVSVTIPEGYARNQVATVAEDAGLRGNYEQETKSFKGFDPGKYGAEDPPSLEGFLFPATYEIFKHAKVGDLVKAQLDAFEQNIAGVDLKYAKSKNLTVYDLLTIASMIEREVQVPEERDDVAAVIYNRLKAGMPLGIDATIRFAVQNFDKPLLESELAVESPYNTRTNTGLPPGPIGSPGLASIEAAANPADVSYLFYVVKPGTCGEHVFTDSEQKAARNTAKYQDALEAKGSSPTDCSE